jgi:squalene-hopene/tetraprenyl-beta-curcumene cyclase
MPRLFLARRRFLAASATLAAAGLLGRQAVAQEAASPDAALYEAMITKGVDYLVTKGQAADGSYSRQAGIGITALAATALLRLGRSPDDPAVAQALKHLEASIQPTGGIHAASGRLKTYETCIAVMCFGAANRAGKYDALLRNADRFLKEVPFDAAEGHEQDSFYFGGAGYGEAVRGGRGRPDLSNTSFLIDALRSTGNGPDQQSIQNALIFVSRCQNLESPHNTTPFAAKINDGGFYYAPIKGDDQDDAGGLRSYGAMSYSGLKSMLFAGLSQDDPRVKAVVKWIGKHYDLKTHPGQGEAGLFYYYLTFAKALGALGQDTIVDEKGEKHDWRRDLAAELARRQRADGSWVNANSQWMEGDANLCTAFALLALSYAGPKK